MLARWNAKNGSATAEPLLKVSAQRGLPTFGPVRGGDGQDERAQRPWRRANETQGQNICHRKGNYCGWDEGKMGGSEEGRFKPGRSTVTVG